MISLVKSKKTKTKSEENRFLLPEEGVGGGVEREWVRGVKMYKLTVLK